MNQWREVREPGLNSPKLQAEWRTTKKTVERWRKKSAQVVRKYENIDYESIIIETKTP